MPSINCQIDQCEVQCVIVAINKAHLITMFSIIDTKLYVLVLKEQLTGTNIKQKQKYQQKE